MIQTLIHKVFGTRHDREMKKLQPLVQAVATWEKRLKDLSDDELKAKTADFKQRFEKGEALNKMLPEAFATMRVASTRVMHMRHYDVQLIGGMVLHRGSIAEMKTGEGKTLTATLPMYLNAISGKGAHLVTVNDYLASRDAEWMGQLYRWMGMSVGIIVQNLSDQQRRDAYSSDITYGTNNEFGFDYLRDNMKFSLTDRVQRPLNFAIVDEVDSILIDEARTPLIISGQAEQNDAIYYRINNVVVDLKRDEDYVVDEEHRSVTLTDEGVDKVQERLGVENLFEPTNIELVHHVTKALEAHTLYKRDERYMVIDGKVVIVDEFTGRQMPGRRWSDGLHQAVEAKEGVKIQAESMTMATITYQNFFRMYEKLAGMTGTADTEAEEFQKIYDLDVVVIPTNKPVIRLDQSDVVYRTEREKFTAIVDQIEEAHKKGQPVLVGTISVDKSEVISKVLKKKKIAHSVLNAKYHDREADIVAQAGRKGAVTIATNMAGRGTDIVLGGNPEALAERVNPDHDSDEFKAALAKFTEKCTAEKQEVLAAGGLFILGTERHDSRRIDNQLRGRAGRQGDPGESRFFLSLEDDLMKRFGADRIQGLLSRLGMEEGVPIEAGMVSKSIENAQKRVEGRNFDVRKHLIEYDDVMEVQRNTIYELRRKILEGDDMMELVLDVLDDALRAIMNMYCAAEIRPADWDLEALARELKDMFGIELDPADLPEGRQKLEIVLWKMVEDRFRAKIDELEYIAEKYNERFDEEADYEPKTKETVFSDLAQQNFLRELDKGWREHLNSMRALRDSVGLQSYAQKDPKYIYKKEGFDLFDELQATINTNVARNLMRMVVKREESVQQASVARNAPLTVRPVGPRPSATAPTPAVPTPAAEPQPRRALPKLGRNDNCWCGSGKKYKHCHLRSDQEAAEGGAPAPAAAAAPAADPNPPKAEDAPTPDDTATEAADTSADAGETAEQGGGRKKPKQGITII